MSSPFSHRRSSKDIILEILECTSVPITRYHIGKLVNLKYADLNRYLNYLTEVGYLQMESRNGKILFKTSATGRDYRRSHGWMIMPHNEAGVERKTQRTLKLRTEVRVLGIKVFERRKSESISPVPQDIEEETMTERHGRGTMLPVPIVGVTFDRKHKRTETYSIKNNSE